MTHPSAPDRGRLVPCLRALAFANVDSASPGIEFRSQVPPTSSLLSRRPSALRGSVERSPSLETMPVVNVRPPGGSFARL